jgi:hypothetical protein
MGFEAIEPEAFGQGTPGFSDGFNGFLASHLSLYQVLASIEGKHLDLVAFFEA